MACGCTESCTCIIVGINGITVTGNGSSGSPYSIGQSALNDTVTTVTIDTTLTNAQSGVVVFVDSTAAPVEITLPAAPTSGVRFIIKDYGATGLGNTSVNAVTVNPGANNIDGLPGPFLYGPSDGDSHTFVSNGSDWANI